MAEENQALQQNVQETPVPEQSQGEALENQSQEEASELESQGKASEPVDDRGVPYSQVVAEHKRKAQEAEERAIRAERLLQQQMTRPVSEKPDNPYSVYEQKVYEKPSDLIKDAVAIAKREILEEQFRREQKSSIARAFAQYPDLNDQSSEMFKKVDEEIRFMQGMGLNPTASANYLEVITTRVARSIGNNGSKSRKQALISQSTTLPNLGTTATKPLSNQQKKELPPLPDKLKGPLMASRELSADEKKKVEQRIRERMAKGEFEGTI